jgi:DNA (cytosine-5)-methyltransferase 1
MLTYGSLFSGVGGFDMGFDQEGYECVFQVEWDKHCQKILAKHWPEVPKWSDVQDVNGAEIPPCDVLTFGSPCQDLSVAGKRAGLDGTKSSMFYEATRIIKEMRNATKSIYPRVVVWENVPGALSSNNGADFGAVIDTLADIGAVDIHWSVLDAQHFGVPQRRRRIFVVAIFDPATSDRCPDPLLPVIKGSRGDFAKGRKARKDIARTAQAGIDSGGQWWDGRTDASDPVNMPLSEFGPTLTTTYGAKNYSNHQEVMSGSVMPVAYPFSESNEIIGALCARDYKGVDNQYVDEGKLVVQDAVVPLKTSNTKANGMNVGEPGDPSYTLDTGGSMAVAYSIREDAKNDNFSATETDIALCLNGLQPSTQSHHAQIFIAEPQPPYVFDGTRHDDFRMDTETVPTLKQRMGTGGGQVPMLAFDPGTVGPLTSTGMSRARGTESVESSHVLAVHTPMVAEPVVYDGYNQKLDDTGIHRSLRIGRDSSDFVAQPTYSFDTQFGSNAAVFENQSPTLKATQQSPSVTMPGLAVRRLTPLECERLMGWPDDHTRWTADGTEQADTHRYKQCGNGVATPVAKWIAKHLKNILITNDDQ